MKSDMLKQLEIPEDRKTAKKHGPTGIVVAVVVFFAIGLAVLFKTRDGQGGVTPANAADPSAAEGVPAAPPQPGDALLTVSGYVIPRERIEISPRFQGTVAWIGVKKGDVVKAGDVLVRLDDEEYRARAAEAEANLSRSSAALDLAKNNFDRAQTLQTKDVSSAQELDDARNVLLAAEAGIKSARANLDLAKLYLEWCTIRAPINGVILEKLVNPNELVSPISYGGARGPSTAFLAMADLSDLQVEIDLNEVDTPKVRLGQRCRVSPEAYPDKVYDGVVAEIAPEANRSKGTLQIKVQIKAPDQFLTPELSAKAEFLAE